MYLVILIALVTKCISCSYKYVNDVIEDEKLLQQLNHEYQVLDEDIITKLQVSQKQCVRTCKKKVECKSINYYMNLTLSDNPCHLLKVFGTTAIEQENVTYIYKTKNIHSPLLVNYCGECKYIHGLDGELPFQCNCTEVFPTVLFKSCEEALNSTNFIAGLYIVSPDGNNSFDVYCFTIREEYGCNLLPGDIGYAAGSEGEESLGVLKNKDTCVRNCYLLSQLNDTYKYGVVTMGLTEGNANGKCYCERGDNIKMSERISLNDYETCAISVLNFEDYAWTTVLQIVEPPFYSDSLSNYLVSYGSWAGNYWLGLHNLYHLSTAENLVLRVEYYLEKDDKIIIEYTNFQLLDNVTFRMFFSGYNPIRTNTNAVDNMRCRNGQPFITVKDKGSFWGNSTLKDVPFYIDGIYWGNSINVKKMKLSVRKLDSCEDIAGEYVAGAGTTSRAIVTFHRGNISALFFDDTIPSFRGSIQASKNPYECVFVVKYEHIPFNTTLTYNKNSCVLDFTRTQFQWSWKKRFCTSSEVMSDCNQVETYGCEDGYYYFNGDVMFCNKGLDETSAQEVDVGFWQTIFSWFG